jgi:uncharacterized membrane protein YhaH (DUF805 family)
VTRGFQWAVLILSALVAVGVFVQVYLIASYIFGAGKDALDAHKNLGGIVHAVEVLVFLAALVGFWKRWTDVGWAFALALIGTIQLSFASGDDWVGGFHGVLALVILILAAVVSHRTMRALNIGPYSPGRAV